MKEYAHILRALADGKQVQRKNGDGEWVLETPSTTLAQISSFVFEPSRYRIKPKTININGHEVPEPLRILPEFGADYFRPVLLANGCLAETCRWQLNMGDLIAFNRGMCHGTQDAAEAHALALLSFTESPYATTEESQALIQPDTRTPAEKELDAMIQEEIDRKGYDLHSVNDLEVLRTIALRLIEERA